MLGMSVVCVTARSKPAMTPAYWCDCFPIGPCCSTQLTEPAFGSGVTTTSSQGNMVKMQWSSYIFKQVRLDLIHMPKMVNIRIFMYK